MLTDNSTFNEILIQTKSNIDLIIKKMLKKGFVAGLPVSKFYKDLDNAMLISVTEKISEEDIDSYCNSLEEIL